ncbi:MAG: ABC transporter permease [Chloroflexota bacterium]
MLIYIAKRLLMTLAVLFLVIVFLSVLVQVVPGDPAKVILGPRASPELIQKVNASMDLDKPIYVQIAKFLWRVLHGDLGKDVFTGVSINRLVGAALPHTIVLALSSLGTAVLIGVPLGVFSATHPDSWLDRLTAILSISFTTIPSYVAGLFLLLIFAVELKVMPAIGLGEEGNLKDYLMHLILPTVALAITWIGYLARLVRTSMLEVLNETYVRAARAAGLSEWLVRYRYALKNALIPTVAVLGVGLGSLMGGAVLVEVIFNRPGMGMLIYTAIKARNYPIVRSGVLVVAFLFVFINFLTDLVYTYLDPRIQLGKSRG